MTITEFFVFLASSAGASAALSFIAQRWPGWEALPANTKSLVMLSGSMLIALAAYAVLNYVPPETLAQLQPIFQIIYGIVGTWLANQIAHKNDPANKPTVIVSTLEEIKEKEG